ncbi:hypothetical protein ACLOJK_015572 [Asimina triloba]
MASSFGLIRLTLPCLVLAFAMSSDYVALGSIMCEKLNSSTCAFAVSWSGTRCVLEKHVTNKGADQKYTCGPSEIEANGLKDWIESDECVEACGVDRKNLGISSDSLLESHFTQKLCSPSCYDNCPNIVDLYSNLAAGEGVFLPQLCQAGERDNNVRRQMGEVAGSVDMVAESPDQSGLFPKLRQAYAPAGLPVKLFAHAPAIPPL